MRAGFVKTKPYFRAAYRRLRIDRGTDPRDVPQMPHTVVVPGFIASDLASGDATNLGRGGSDYTAAILASTLDAAMLEIWTDVDGFMTADPKVINNAYVIERLS